MKKRELEERVRELEARLANADRYQMDINIPGDPPLSFALRDGETYDFRVIRGPAAAAIVSFTVRKIR
jgi:hypothetical protein